MRSSIHKLPLRRLLSAAWVLIPVCAAACLWPAWGASKEDAKDWKHAGSLWLLTTPDGADLPAEAVVEGFPVLVRLHRDWFDFSQAQPHGEDVRFTSSTGEPLAFQIEAWDAERGEAAVWVRVPRIVGNARQELRMRWGNPEAESASDGRAVFNASNGYVSVWHMSDPVADEVGTLPSTDAGTTAVPGRIAAARHFPGGKGVFCGDKIPNYPSGASAHSTEAWFRTTVPNTTIIGWGNEGGGRGSKVRMLLRSPPHIRIDSDFSDVRSDSRLTLGDWIHVVHTYERGMGRLYINGRLDGSAQPTLDIKSPARLWLGGWYHNYDFVGDLDEVRISQVVRSADWIKLQYGNQQPQQTLVGPLVQPGDEFSVSPRELQVSEGKQATLTARAGGAQKVAWILNRGGKETVVATDRFTYTFDAGRVAAGSSDLTPTLTFRAVYPQATKAQDVPITIQDDVPEPEFTLNAPPNWDGRKTIEIVPRVANRAALEAAGAGRLNVTWSVDDVAVLQRIEPDRLILKRAQGSGTLRVTAAIDNGGAPRVQTATIAVKEPTTADAWLPRPLAVEEQPEEGQFIPRDGTGRDGVQTGTLVYAGKLAEAADSVFVRVYAGDKLVATETAKPDAERVYVLRAKLEAKLVKYRTEFGTKIGNTEKILHQAGNIVCGDVFLIDGQSNAEATDVGPVDPPFTSDWIRSYGSTAGDPQNARLRRWGPAVVRDRQGGKAQIGYWGMELAKRLVETTQIPVCIINGAVGGSRIDQHQRNPDDPADVRTIYGRLLGRVQQARLTHGVRAILWHQGENDQGADGPSGGFGYETYRRDFVAMSAGWKEDYPNVQRYYVFQIWPKACAMGVNGSDNQLREVQRTLPRLYSNLSVMSTLGVKPPGGCHFPAEGYAEFARLIAPLVEAQIYHRAADGPLTPPNLQRAFFATDRRDELVLEFDDPVVWADPLVSQFHLTGAPPSPDEAQPAPKDRVVSGAVNGNRLTLKLAAPSRARKITYLDSASWNPDNLLYGPSGLAALTFCDVPIDP